MDLSDIESWSRQVLEKEARKRGMRNPEVYTQAELARLILRHDYGSPRSLREAAKLVKGVLGHASSALRAGLGSGQRKAAGGRREEDRSARQAVPSSSASSAKATSGSLERGVRNGAANTAATLPPPTVARRDDAAQSATLESAQPALDESLAGDSAASDSAEVSRASAQPVRSPSSPTLPYAASAARSPDAEPHENLQRNRLESAPASRALETRGPSDEASDRAQIFANEQAAHADANHLSCRPHSSEGLRVRWQVSQEGVTRARAVLGAEGELAVRVVVVRIEAGQAVRTEITDHGPVELSGDWTAPLAADPARYVSSIGLRTNERFVSIAHATA